MVKEVSYTSVPKDQVLHKVHKNKNGLVLRNQRGQQGVRKSSINGSC